MEYKCECCNYTTQRKFNYDKHILSNKHKLVESSTVEKSTEILIPKMFECNYCEKTFKFEKILFKHIVNCKNQKNIKDLTEIVQIMIIQSEKQQNEINKQTLQIEKIISEIF